jgi:hypothetical protein
MQAFRSPFDDVAHNLMSGDSHIAHARKFFFSNVKIGSAHATGSHPKEQMTVLYIRTCDLPDLKDPALQSQE